jgi:uncharacterized protein YndB with AHSA1/START domain
MSERKLELSIEVPGTPEEVWEAIASGPGISSWFAPTDLDGRVGGTVTTDFGPYGKDTAPITVWDPPHRLRGESQMGDEVLAHEWLVEARGGGTCIVRVVASGFGTGDDWDATYDGLATGWRIFLENLRLHLTNFRGRHAQGMHELAPMSDTTPTDAWRTFCAALGVSTELRTGDRFETTAAGAPSLGGIVATVLPNAYVLRVDTPTPGTGFVSAEPQGGQVVLHLALYLYDDDDGAVRDATVAEWAAWMPATFGAPSTH